MFCANFVFAMLEPDEGRLAFWPQPKAYRRSGSGFGADQGPSI